MMILDIAGGFKSLNNRRRYYSHRMIKKDKSVKFFPRERTIYCNDIDSLKKTTKRHVLLLRNNFNYNIQTYIV